MPGIALDTVQSFQHRVTNLKAKYIADWNRWLATPVAGKPVMLGKILRKWQACRPNNMRRERAVANHSAPYLEDIVAASAAHIVTLKTFDIAHASAVTNPVFRRALTDLWVILEDLSYRGTARNGLAGTVGISKAVMLLTDGRVGPAFDDKVRKALRLRTITNSDEWFAALTVVSDDIQAFEHAQNTSFNAAKPPTYAHLHNGRIYDMALGPR